jgi:hypothetical protein
LKLATFVALTTTAKNNRENFNRKCFLIFSQFFKQFDMKLMGFQDLLQVKEYVGGEGSDHIVRTTKEKVVRIS